MLLFRIYHKVFLHHLHSQTQYSRLLFLDENGTNSFLSVTLSEWIFDIFLIFPFPMTKRGAFVFTDWGNWPLIALSAFSCSRNDCICNTNWNTRWSGEFKAYFYLYQYQYTEKCKVSTEYKQAGVITQCCQVFLESGYSCLAQYP